MHLSKSDSTTFPFGCSDFLDSIPIDEIIARHVSLYVSDIRRYTKK
jgi:hypothetical protein